jgi:hypothetical protein
MPFLDIKSAPATVKFAVSTQIASRLHQTSAKSVGQTITTRYLLSVVAIASTAIAEQAILSGWDKALISLATVFGHATSKPPWATPPETRHVSAALVCLKSVLRAEPPRTTGSAAGLAPGTWKASASVMRVLARAVARNPSVAVRERSMTFAAALGPRIMGNVVHQELATERAYTSRRNERADGC